MKGHARTFFKALYGPSWLIALVLVSSGCSRAVVRDGAPSWSPDSQRIVFFRETVGHPADLFVMRADGGDVRPLTKTEKASEGYPAFSPDGKTIAYESDAVGGNFDIWVMDAKIGRAHV